MKKHISHIKLFTYSLLLSLPINLALGMISLPPSSPGAILESKMPENQAKKAIDQGAEELKRILASYKNEEKLYENLTWADENGGLALYIINHPSEESLKLLDIFLSVEIYDEIISSKS